MGNILITGGAGYIGSHIAEELKERGRTFLILDDFSQGHRGAVGDCRIIEGDYGNKELLGNILKKEKIRVVIHMAAKCLVGESVKKPDIYFRENLLKGLDLLDAMRESGADKIVFSSSAAVFGEPKTTPIRADAPTEPINPYGETKLFFEKILERYDGAYEMKFVSLRYFNAAGAHRSGEIGEDHEPETHLIPLVLKAALGLRDHIEIFGRDYPTPDGTCVRDYIHVTDLARAHVLALEHLESEGSSGFFNLGSGTGSSILEILETSRRVTGRNIPSVDGPRREGDPAVLVAESSAIMEALGWSPRFSELEDIIETAWRWHRDHPGGFKE